VYKRVQMSSGFNRYNPTQDLSRALLFCHQPTISARSTNFEIRSSMCKAGHLAQNQLLNL